MATGAAATRPLTRLHRDTGNTTQRNVLDTSPTGAPKSQVGAQIWLIIRIWVRIDRDLNPALEIAEQIHCRRSLLRGRIRAGRLQVQGPDPDRRCRLESMGHRAGLKKCL